MFAVDPSIVIVLVGSTPAFITNELPTCDDWNKILSVSGSIFPKAPTSVVPLLKSM